MRQEFDSMAAQAAKRCSDGYVLGVTCICFAARAGRDLVSGCGGMVFDGLVLFAKR